MLLSSENDSDFVTSSDSSFLSNDSSSIHSNKSSQHNFGTFSNNQSLNYSLGGMPKLPAMQKSSKKNVILGSLKKNLLKPKTSFFTKNNGF